MSDNKLQKKYPNPIKEKGQYFLAFGVVASMLLVAGFPVFVIFFFGVFAYFLLRMFASGSRNETREIFEFYLAANEILRDDERRWFGFEINDVIGRGQTILQRMSGAPPLVHFALGALYNKIGDHKAAINNLSYIVENEGSDESSYAFPTPELRNYVKVLRKIERDPADAPLTSSAVRALERARKLRAKSLLEESRTKFTSVPSAEIAGTIAERSAMTQFVAGAQQATRRSVTDDVPRGYGESDESSAEQARTNGRREKSAVKNAKKADPFLNRKPISEVLHDIYDTNVQ